MNIIEKMAKIAVNKSLLKEFHTNENDRIVYLNNGDEFQIQVFNPYSYVIGVSFSFNSFKMSNKLLVLKPGERIWLDRYLDDEQKLKFSTYEVGNSKEVKKAIEKNGLIEVFFYKEQEIKSNKNIYIYNPKGWQNYTSQEDNSGYKPIDIYYNTSITRTNIDSTISPTSLIGSKCLYTSSAASTYSNLSADNSLMPSSSKFNNKIETGRIEKGSHSNQKFYNYYGDFESWYFKSETIKILPKSQKQISSNDLIKKYCPECGRKIKPTFKFCPGCGTKL